MLLKFTIAHTIWVACQPVCAINFLDSLKNCQDHGGRCGKPLRGIVLNRFAKEPWFVANPSSLRNTTHTARELPDVRNQTDSGMLLRAFRSPECARERERASDQFNDQCRSLLDPLRQQHTYSICAPRGPSSPKIAYLHNHKAASTSIISMMAAAFPTWRCHTFDEMSGLLDKERTLTTVDAFRDHFKFTFVREPVATFMSGWNWLLQGLDFSDPTWTRFGAAHGAPLSHERNVNKGDHYVDRHDRPFALHAEDWGASLNASLTEPCDQRTARLTAFVDDVEGGRTLGCWAYHVWPQVARVGLIGTLGPRHMQRQMASTSNGSLFQVTTCKRVIATSLNNH